VALTSCNPSYLGGWDERDTGSRTAWAKSLQDPISTNSQARWHTPVIPATWGNENRRITVLSQPEWKTLWDFISTEESWVWWYVLGLPVTARDVKEEACGPTSLGKKQDPIFQHNLSKKSWWCGSSGRALGFIFLTLYIGPLFSGPSGYLQCCAKLCRIFQTVEYS
jgi:hypothetical protein